MLHIYVCVCNFQSENWIKKVNDDSGCVRCVQLVRILIHRKRDWIGAGPISGQSRRPYRRIEVKATLQRCVTCFWPSHLLFAFPIKVAIKAAVQSWPRAYRVDTAYVTKAVLSRPVNKVVPQIQFVSRVKCVCARPNILCFDTKIQILYFVCIISFYFSKYIWLKNYSKL